MVSRRELLTLGLMAGDGTQAPVVDPLFESVVIELAAITSREAPGEPFEDLDFNGLRGRDVFLIYLAFRCHSGPFVLH